MAPTPAVAVVGDGAVDPLAGYVVGVLGASGVGQVARRFEEQGATVVAASSNDSLPTNRLLDSVAYGVVDGLALLDVDAADHLVAALQRLRIAGEIRTALRGRTLVGAADAVVADSLAEAAIVASAPSHSATDQPLVQLLVDEIPASRGRVCVAAGHSLDVRSQAVVIDGVLQALPASAIALLRALAQQPGHVVTREKLLALLPGERVSGHAVDVAIGRLRTALGDPAIVVTVVKRGYRLAVA
jgi:uroporphyrinogen-III synthase